MAICVLERPGTEAFGDVYKKAHPALLRQATEEVVTSGESWRSVTVAKETLKKALEVELAVACTARGASFKGDAASKEAVRMKLGVLLDLIIAREKGEAHWALTEEVGLDFYLCQCTVLSGRKGCAGTDTAAREPELAVAAELFRIPDFVAPESFSELNLWIGGSNTTTNLHYDCSHNWLFVLTGGKDVTLFAPAATATLRPNPVYSESANHSTLTPREVEEMAGAAGTAALRVSINAGEALFIPEGWWHQVSSQHGTIAVNVWFRGVNDDVICSSATPHMRNFYLRCLLGSLLAEEKTRLLSQWQEKLAEGEAVDGATTALAPLLRRVRLATALGELSWLAEVAMQEPSTYSRLLRALTPADCQRVVVLWDAASDGGAFADAFRAAAAAEEELKLVLLHGAEAFASEALSSLLRGEK